MACQCSPPGGPITISKESYLVLVPEIAIYAFSVLRIGWADITSAEVDLCFSNPL